MTSPKTLKAQVRARMAETGESYTAARRRLMSAGSASSPASSGDPSPEPDDAYPFDADNGSEQDGDEPAAGASRSAGAERSGGSAGAGHGVQGITGHSYDEWFARLDDWGASQRTHTQLARWLVREHEVKGAWAQTIAVAYEQARGMRAPGEREAGLVAVSLNRSIDVPAEDVFHAFVDEWIRTDWLPEVSVRVRTATSPVSVRADWRDRHGTTGQIALDLQARTPDQTQLVLTHEGLAGADETARMKAFWQEHLDLLKDLLENG